MLYRRSTQIAVQATLVLALEPPGGCRRVREIAAELGVPATYLAKIVQSLRRVGWLRTLRGPRGGVQLIRSPRDIALWDVLAAVEPIGEFERCPLHGDRCSDVHACPLHEAWAPIRSQILALLQSKNLWELATEAQRRGVLGRQTALGANRPRRSALPEDKQQTLTRRKTSAEK